MAELVFSRMENGPSSDEGYRDECDLNNFKLGMMWKTTKSLLKRTNRPECVIFRVAGSLKTRPNPKMAAILNILKYLK